MPRLSLTAVRNGSSLLDSGYITTLSRTRRNMDQNQTNMADILCNTCKPAGRRLALFGPVAVCVWLGTANPSHQPPAHRPIHTPSTTWHRDPPSPCTESPPPPSPSPPSSLPPSGSMSSPRSTVSPPRAVPAPHSPPPRERRKEQAPGLRRQRKGGPPDLCRVLGHRPCRRAYPPCRRRRNTPLGPGTPVSTSASLP